MNHNLKWYESKRGSNQLRLELNVRLDKRVGYVLSKETFSTTTEAKSFMKKKNYWYRGLRDGRKKGHKMLFTCSRYNKCPKKCYVLLKKGL
jgi:hypothetical protein